MGYSIIYLSIYLRTLEHLEHCSQSSANNIVQFVLDGLALLMVKIVMLLLCLQPLLLAACFQGWVVPAAVVKVSLAGHSCADIIVAARPGQPRPDSAVCGGDSTSGEAAPGG